MCLVIGFMHWFGLCSWYEHETVKAFALKRFARLHLSTQLCLVFNCVGRTPLYYAAYNGQEQVLNLLISTQNVNLNAQVGALFYPLPRILVEKNCNIKNTLL